MRRTTKTILFIALTALGWLEPSRAVAQTKIRLATLLPRGSSHYQILESMGQQWREASGGSINLTIYADGTMGGEAETVQRMRVGQIQAATLSVGGLSEIDPSVGALQKIPMVYHSLDEMEYVRSRMEPELEQRLEAKGFVVLFWADTGWVNIFCRQPAMHPDEFKHTKVFVGADTVPTVPFFALAGQYDLVARHMLDLPWVPLIGATVITKRAWDAIPPQYHEAFRRAAADAGKEMQARGRQESLEAIEAMKKRGLKVHPVSPELQEEWRRFAEAVYPRMRGSMVPADMFDEVLKLIREYRGSGGGAKS